MTEAVATVRVEYLSCGCVRFRDQFSPGWSDQASCPACGQQARCLYFERRNVWRPDEMWVPNEADDKVGCEMQSWGIERPGEPVWSDQNGPAQ